jgi:hypothetical protein
MHQQPPKITDESDAGTLELREEAPGAVLAVHSKPRPSKTQVKSVLNGALEVARAAPPVDGAANEELVRALAVHFDLPKSRVTVVSGETSRHEKVRLDGLTAGDVLAKATSRR